jgi:hypothetical protein
MSRATSRVSTIRMLLAFTLATAIALMVAALLLMAPTAANAATPGFGISSFSTTASSTQAGAHADLTTSFTLNTNAEGEPVDQVKDVEVELPSGVIGNPLSVPRCSAFDYASLRCTPATQVGVIEPTLVFPGGEGNPPQITSGPLALYNVQPQPGHVATFEVFGLLFSIMINVDVRNDGSYALTANIHDLTTLIPISATSIHLWGVPADPSHEFERRPEEFSLSEKGAPAGVAPTPFMTNPSDCSSGPLTSRVRVDSWQHPGTFVSATTTQPAPTGCDRLRAAPTVVVTPDTTRQDSPAGYDIDLKVPQNEDPYGLGTPFMQKLSFALPLGTSLSPAAAGGLEACSDTQFAGDDCPDGSRIGTTSITSPVLPEQLTGSIYLGTPTPSQPYRIFMVASGSTVTIPLAGSIQADPTTGQLTTVFENLPQEPFSEIHLHFNGGATAALVNPASCGPATTSVQADFDGGLTTALTSTFTVDADGHGGACPSNAPFAPTFSAGTTSPLAGGFSPLTMTVSREDGQQPLSTISAQLPPGLLGMLARVPACGEPQAAQGNCPQAALIGTTTVAAGAGAQPLYLSGSIYLTAPYEGAPFGAAIVVPLTAGPFSLGTLVLRTRILVDPSNLQLTIASDPIPQIVNGIPLRVRTVNLTINRQGFIFNPTDCLPHAITATLGSTTGASVTASSPFQVGGCPGLPFGPKLSASTQAKASSRGNGAGLNLKVSFPTGTHANIKAVSFTMPKHLLARLTTIQQACTVARFTANPASCPSGSLVGSGAVSTPVLNSLLTGPIYLVSHGRAAFPDLRMVLQGEGISLDLNGTLQLSDNGTIKSAFGSVPDVPINSFTLSLPEGPHSALASNGSLCAQSLSAPYTISGQNGAQVTHTAKVAVAGCQRRHTASRHANKAAKHARKAAAGARSR